MAGGDRYHWALHLLTGKNRPACRVSRVLRSSKLIESGRTAVGEGVLPEDGAVAAVVIDAADETVWACHFNHGTCAPEETVLLKDLETVPALGEGGHSDWLRRWEQHITCLLRRQPGRSCRSRLEPGLKWEGRA